MKNFLIACMISLLSACSGTYESTQQVDESAFIQLQGNFLNTQLTVDDAAPISIAKGSVQTYELEGKVVAKFPISTGSHTIKITRGDQVIVMRKIYVTNGNAFEVTVP